MTAKTIFDVKREPGEGELDRWIGIATILGVKVSDCCTDIEIKDRLPVGVRVA